MRLVIGEDCVPCYMRANMLYQLCTHTECIMQRIARTWHTIWRFLWLQDLRKGLLLHIKSWRGEDGQDLDNAIDICAGCVSSYDPVFSAQLLADRLQTFGNRRLSDIPGVDCPSNCR